MALNLLGAQMGGGFTGGTAMSGGDQGGSRSATGDKNFNFGPPGAALRLGDMGPVGILFAVVAALLVLLWILRSTKR